MKSKISKIAREFFTCLHWSVKPEGLHSYCNCIHLKQTAEYCLDLWCRSIEQTAEDRGGCRIFLCVLGRLPNSALDCIIWQRGIVYYFFFFAFLLSQRCWPFTSLRFYLLFDCVRLSCPFLSEKNCLPESCEGSCITCSCLLQHPELPSFILASLLRRNPTWLPLHSLFGF
jgi:hypothetical protein